MENKSINNSLKIKFIFILILSNASVFLITSPTETVNPRIKIKNPRLDYIYLRVTAENKTALDSNTPVQLISNDRQIIIKNVFVLDKVERNQDNLLARHASSSQYLIHIHNEDAKLLDLSKSFLFLPTKYSTSKSRKRRNYEVIF